MKATAVVKAVLRHGLASLGPWDQLRGAEDPGPRILSYHGVCAEPPDEWSVTPAQLAAQMRYLARARRPVAVGVIVDWLLGGPPPPPRAVAVTFDDGFRDVLEHAAPILAEAGVPGAAFVPSALMAGGASAAHGDFAVTRPLLDIAGVRALRGAGWTIGSHARTHARLAALPEAAARRELADSRAELEQALGEAVALLAYPFGTHQTVSPRDQRLAAQAGYRAALMNMTAPLQEGAVDPMAIPRSKVLGSDGLRVLRATLQGTMDRWFLIESRD